LLEPMNITLNVFLEANGNKFLQRGTFPVKPSQFKKDPDQEAARVANNWIREIRRVVNGQVNIVKVIYDGEADITELVH
jgi:hypothetical protein